ncbi:MAG: chordopoxvirus fusion protein [Desulfobacteraceae bacterium]|nr:chordopoxvirus fusion protein [Desulfobacteraceae bacterium]
MPFSVTFMRKLDSADAELKDILWSLLEEIERDREESVTKQEFRELSELVGQLGQATRELAEAQKKSEQRLDRIEQIVGELAEAQKKSEQRLDRIEQIVGELAEAQKRTEQELRELAYEHKQTRKQLGGLAMTVGYGLENKIYPVLPDLLKRDFGLVVQERLVRRFVKDRKGNDIEVNIFGKASRNGEDVVIIGEAKSQLSEKDIQRFLRKKVKPFEGMFAHPFLVLVTHMITSPDVEKIAKNHDIALYYSYDL